MLLLIHNLDYLTHSGIVYHISFQYFQSSFVCDLRVSWQWLWRVLSSVMWHCLVWQKFINVLGEHMAPIFKLEASSEPSNAWKAYFSVLKMETVITQYHLQEVTAYEGICFFFFLTKFSFDQYFIQHFYSSSTWHI